MPSVTVGRWNSADIEVYYEDHGVGQPVVPIYGDPLHGRGGDKQVLARGRRGVALGCLAGRVGGAAVDAV